MQNAELLENWLSWLQFNKGRSERTTAKYRAYLAGLEAWLADRDTKFLSASKAQLEEFTGLVAHKQGISPRSRKPLVAAVRGFYQYLADNGHIDENPAAALPYPKAGFKLPRTLSLASAEAMLMQPDLTTFLGLRDVTIMSMLLGIGLRLDEVTKMNQEDLLFYDDKGVERLVVRVTGKGKKERMLPAPHECRLLVRAYLNHPDLLAVDRTLPDGNRVLWISTNSRHVPEHEYFGEQRRLSYRGIQDIINRHGEQAGIPKEERNPHAFRHRFGTEMAEADVNLLKIQALMGHAKPETTEVYVHLAVRSLSQSVDRANPLGKIKTPVTDLLHRIS